MKTMREERATRPGARFRFLPVLERYVLWDLSGTMAVAFVFLMGLMALLILLEAGRRTGVEASMLLSILPCAGPLGLRYAIPLALLLGVTFTFSRLAAGNELTALRAAGSTLRPLLGPVLLVALLLSLALLFVMMQWLPQAGKAKRRILGDTAMLLKNLPRGRQNLNLGGGFSIYYGDCADGILSNVVITEIREGALQKEIVAEEGRWMFDAGSGDLRIELRNSQATWFGPRPGGEQKILTGRVVVAQNLEVAFPDSPRRVEDLTLSQILGFLEAMRDLPEGLAGAFRWKRSELEYELHGRYAESFSPLLMAILGMPLGAMVRMRGRLVAFFAGFLPILVLYYPIQFLGSGLGSRGAVPPAAAAWAADAVVGILGALLTWRMTLR